MDRSQKSRGAERHTAERHSLKIHLTEAFTIGKYLTPKLFIGYGIGLARRGSVLIVRYLIRDDIEFEATNGEQSRASLNYIIEK